MDDSSATNLPEIIAAEGDYAAVHALLSRRTGAPGVLRRLMTLFESYRSARKYGWSRPWNKGGLRTFLTLEFSPRADASYSSLAADWTDIARSQATSAHDRSESAFLSSLVATSAARGFVFLHERLDAQGLFEGFTLSFGAVSARGRRYRDRFDVVVEQKIDNDDLPSKAMKSDIYIRVYEDRFLLAEGNSGERGSVPLLCQTLLPGDHVDVAHLLSDSLTLLRRDALDTARHWAHWTQDVIDYFGPRRFPELATWFNESSFLQEMARRKTIAFRAMAKKTGNEETRA